MPTEYRSDGAARSNQSAIVVVPFSQNPHAATFDGRLHSFDKVLLNALMFFALDSDRCSASDARLAEMLDVSVDTIRRSLANLEACGYIRREKVAWTPINRTGREVVLVWRTNPAVLPPVPERYSVHLAEGTAPVEPKSKSRRPRNPGPPAPVPGVPPAPVRVVSGPIEATTPGTDAGQPPAPMPGVPPAPVPDKGEASGKVFEKAHDGLRGGASRRPIKAPRTPLPRARALWMNSKNPR